MSLAPLLGAESGSEPAAARPPPSSSWVERVVDTAEARAQLGFAVPMVVTSMAYYGIPLVSVMFSGHLGDVQLAGATLGNSWATVTGYAFVVRTVRARAAHLIISLARSLAMHHVTVSESPIHSRSPRCRFARRRIRITRTARTRRHMPTCSSPPAYPSTLHKLTM
jgi:hypothetical protein